ncbi:MAG: PilZ domain-containing protein [Terriglobia bacterium]|jgi:hypothetical protein
METRTSRRSDRVFLELDIVVTGCELSGREFVERTQTLVLSRHGAKILSRYQLVPQQEVIIRCVKTDKEAVACVVGTIGETPEGYYYGIAALDPEFNMWDIEFPPLSEAEAAGSKTLLECFGCHKLEVVCLGVFELEVLMASQRLLRYCERCADSSVWKQASEKDAQKPAAEAAPPPLPPPRTQNDRKYARVNIKVDACLRLPGRMEEIVLTENASRGGIRFRSKTQLQMGATIEVAVPYAQGGVNIFVPARIAYSEKTPDAGVSAYGVCYISERMASSSGGKRTPPPS